MHTRSIASNEQIGTLDNSPFCLWCQLVKSAKHQIAVFTARNEDTNKPWGKVMFLQASVILLTGGCLPPPNGADTHRHTHTPREQTSPREQTPPGKDPPGADPPPPSRAC